MLELRKVREVLKHHLILCWEGKTIVLLGRKEHCKSSCSHVLKQKVLYNLKNVCCYIQVFQYFKMRFYWVTYCHHPVLCILWHAVGLADISPSPLPDGLLFVGSTRGKQRQAEARRDDFSVCTSYQHLKATEDNYV